MLNKEKYAKEILNIACSGNKLALRHNIPYPCNTINCSKCYLWTRGCTTGFTEWANSEYKEIEIDWKKVPVDTPVYVRNDSSNDWKKKHFCKFDSDNKLYYCYCSGRTSWTDEGCVDVCDWKQCKLAEGVDCSEWYKD